MPSVGSRHEAIVSATTRWIFRFTDARIFEYEKREDSLSQKDRDTWRWYQQFSNEGTSVIPLPDAHHSPDAQFGPAKEPICPLVLEVADSQSLESLQNLATEYLHLGKGLIKYVFGVNIQDMTNGSDVDLIIWKHIITQEGKHSSKKWRSYVRISYSISSS